MRVAVNENGKQNNDVGEWSLLEMLKWGCLSFERVGGIWEKGKFSGVWLYFSWSC